MLLQLMAVHARDKNELLESKQDGVVPADQEQDAHQK